MKILFLSNRPTENSQATTVTEYLDSLHEHSKFDIYEISMLHYFPSRVNLDNFDVVITHYSLSIGPLMEHYLGKDLICKLKDFRGLKAAFLQDEYREIETYWKNINYLGIDILFSIVPNSEINKVYPKNKLPNLKVVNVLTGYVSEKLLQEDVAPIKNRKIDVGYRTRKMPYWLGRLAYEKWSISIDFERHAKNKNFILDLSTNETDRLYGESWTKFIASCKTILGVESGASIIDFSGELEKDVDSFVSMNPNSTFEEVFNIFLKKHEGSLKLNQISPRCFEAAALRTPMILFEGRYSGILKPNKHFIPLKKDFSNIDDVLLKLNDIDYLQKMADRTYHEIALNPKYSYKEFINLIDKEIEITFKNRKKKKNLKIYTYDKFKSDINFSFIYILNRKFVLLLQRIILGIPFARKLIFNIWFMLPNSLKKIARPLAKLISR